MQELLEHFQSLVDLCSISPSKRRIFTAISQADKSWEKYKKMMVSFKSNENHVAKYPTVTNFKYSNRWFNGFCMRNKFSLRRKTRVSQKSSAQLKTCSPEILCEVATRREM